MLITIAFKSDVVSPYPPRNGGLTATDSGTRPIDDIVHAIAEGEAAGCVISPARTVNYGVGVTTDGGELVFSGRDCEFAEVNPALAVVGARTSRVVTIIADPTRDSKLTLERYF